VFEIAVNFLAGAGAGVVIGFLGASAVVVTAPLLILLLRYAAYEAIGIALSVDVLASASATLVYRRYGRVKIRQSLPLLISALLAAGLGSYLSEFLASRTLGTFSGVGSIIGGVVILFKGGFAASATGGVDLFHRHDRLFLILAGITIGGIAGVFGVGGGVMIVVTLIVVLDFEIHEAVGTAVLLMMFIALLGGIAHYVIRPFPLIALACGTLGGVLGALGSATLANALSRKTLAVIAGSFILILGIVLTLWEALR
jgi:uncharacterized membrane protein YfcA